MHDVLNNNFVIVKAFMAIYIREEMNSKVHKNFLVSWIMSLTSDHLETVSTVYYYMILCLSSFVSYYDTMEK
jgi:hypothetical protein